MTHYLRRYGRNVVGIEATATDIHCVVSLAAFCGMLLNSTISDHQSLIDDFHDIQEIRGEWFEGNWGPITPDEHAENRCRELAERWGLEYVTD